MFSFFLGRFVGQMALQKCGTYPPQNSNPIQFSVTRSFSPTSPEPAHTNNTNLDTHCFALPNCLAYADLVPDLGARPWC